MIPLNPALAATQRPPVMEARRWLEGVTFTKTSSKNAQGDKNLKVDMDFIIVHGITRDGVKAV